ncbi:MAG: ATP-dependent Clp protease proteolytic subunit [Pseudohongiellaceae bacterium]|jgi:ATP-dependent Clp protease protease subunit
MTNQYVTQNDSGKSVMEKEKPEVKEGISSGFMDEKLFKSRAITIFGEINDRIARAVTERLLALASESDDPICLYISSPGGHVESGDVVYDMMKFIKPEVKVIGTGWVASAATTIFLAADKNNRFALPNTRFLIHQPSGGSLGVASDIAIQAKEIIKMRARINKLIAEETGQPLERVEKDTDRDYWMSVEEAIEYGIVSKVVRSITEI